MIHALVLGGMAMLLFPMGMLAAAEGDPKATGHPEAIYGPALPIVAELGVGPTMAVAVQGQRAYLIGKGRLRVADISRPEAPRVVGELAGLGNTRQILVDGDTAYISSREDGLFVVDVSRPEAPRLRCHYDSVEFATGLARGGKVLFLASRQFGVELVDITDPDRPRHLSIARTGEAQSAAYHNGYLYVGVWGSSELVVVDVRDARRPVITERVKLDGFGDGVTVSGNLVLVATGHHSRQKPNAQAGDPGFGHGHGLEILDLADPAHPKPLSRLKFPPFYAIGNDMWGVCVANGHAFVSDTHNGIFVVDIRDPRQPRCVGHHQLPYMEKYKLPAFIGGLALAKDHIYMAGGWTDLHVVAAPGLAEPVVESPGAPPTIGPAPASGSERYERVPLDGQVYNVAFHGETALVAAGSAGVQVVRLLPEFQRLHQYPVSGFAMDVEVMGEVAYVAEGKGGLSLWRFDTEGGLKRVGHYDAGGQTVRQVIVPAPGCYALLHVGSTTLQVVDVSDPTNPRRVYQDPRLVLMYGDQIADGLVGGRYACAFGHSWGLAWYDLAGADTPAWSGDHYPQRMSMLDGIAVMGERVLAVAGGGYTLIERGERRPLAELPSYRVPGVHLSGKPVIVGDTLTLTNRAKGEVLVLDISDLTAPRLRERFQVAGSPSRVVPHGGYFIIPGGYEGVLLCKRRE